MSGVRFAGVARENDVVSLGGAGFQDVLSVVRGGPDALTRVRAYVAAAPVNAVVAMDDVTFCAPIPRPPKILCVGLNYRDHALEAGMAIPASPTIFAKFPNTVIGSGADIVLPANSEKPDYEAEFAFVIGKGGRHLKAADWREHVFGYMNFNDVSARDVQLAVTQWTMGKNFDTFGPMGPWLVSADEIADPHQLDISLTLDGVVVQRSNTRELIFKIPELVEFLSGVMTLEPGDVVSTGTPAGVGMARVPPLWLRPGSDVRVHVEGLGELRNRCVAEVVR